MLYPVAREGVFRTVQGEGVLCGLPMLFVRLAGCSVGCAGCDTDYSTRRLATAGSLREEAKALTGGSLEWAWITGGEPTDHDIAPLMDAIRSLGVKVAMATSGIRPVPAGPAMGGPDFLSVSPHRPERWVQRTGDQLNLVPGLGGLSLDDPFLIEAVESCWRDFGARYATPMADRFGRVSGPSLEACRRWVDGRRGWRLGTQAHKAWGLP